MSIEERDRRPELPSRARELGTKVSVLMCGPRVSAKGEREGAAAGLGWAAAGPQWGARAVGEDGPKLGWLARLALLFYF